MNTSQAGLTTQDVRDLRRVAHTLMSSDDLAPEARRVAHAFKTIATQHEEVRKDGRWCRLAAVSEVVDKVLDRIATTPPAGGPR